MVLLVALVAVWSLTPDDLWGGRPGLRQHVRPDGVLATFGRFLPPLGLVVGVYLVWVGTSAPGGAFQAGTVLAAVWLLAMMAGLMEPPPVSGARLRWLLAVGPLLFLAVGLFGIGRGAFLRYPPEHAKALILTIEFALAASIAVTLALLVLGPPRRAR
jgi:multisubunit Na+/H+ antiporter MnhB subunit